ncbi:urease accessory protein UreD [Nocardia sp. NPDC004654]|uniref:urease accessory protein UreD n=1 Tax=Nocardia sp. NPDC004654 TaxID=3154776 RepID=UPI0033AF4DF8
MRTDLRIVATTDALPEIHASGGLAARRTGPHTVHLVGTAATPLGGDELHISVTVGQGARLAVRSVAATIALPAATTRISCARWLFEVAEGGELDVETEPLIVAGGADHRAVTTVRLAADARLRLRERVQIGRAGEDRGAWRGDLIADLDGLPLLRHRLELGCAAATDDALSASRALDSELVYPDDRPVETFGLHATRLPLAAGGSLFTAVGARLSATTSPRTLSDAAVSAPATA